MSSIAVLRSNTLRLLPLAAFSMVAACSSAPITPGDYALAQGKKWNEGAEMVGDGQDLIRKGNKQIETGTANVSKGKNMISEGQSMIAEAEAALKAQQLETTPRFETAPQ